MKKILSMVLAGIFCASIAFGAVGIKVNSVHQGTATDINFPTGTTVTTSDGSTFTVSPVVGAVAAVTSGTIRGVTINSSTIGATTPSTAVFTTASATNLSATNMNSTIIGATTPSTAVFTTMSATTASATNLSATNMNSTAIGATTPSTAVFTTASATALSATNMNSTAIGATTPSTAVFTTMTTTGRQIKDVAVLTPSAAITVDCSLADVFTLVPANTGTIQASNVTAGQNITLVITTSGTTDYTLTFATGFTTTGTLATGSSSGKVFVMDFISPTGTTQKEKSRTTAM